MIYGMNSRINFGKHKDELVSTVLRKDPRWLDWAHENVEWFELDEEVQVELESALEEEALDNYFPEQW